MIEGINPASTAAKLLQRLSAVSEILRSEAPSRPGPDPGRDAADLLDSLVRAVQREITPDRVWLLCTAVFGTYPTGEQVVGGGRFLELAPAAEAVLWLLDQALEGDPIGAATYELLVIANRTVVDVDHAARHDLHTGIQQVVRRTLPLWHRDFPIMPVGWTPDGGGLRVLSEVERDRVLRWGIDAGDLPSRRRAHTLVAPWRTVVAVLETPAANACDRLAALAQYSGNSLVAIGYDCVPIVSADMVPPEEPTRFLRYLTALKHAKRVAAISASAAIEFRGFSSALNAQGFSGPTVIECGLPTESGALVNVQRPVPAAAASPVPVVLCVGSLEPRKNHLALLYAAERLWRDGHEFELALIAGSGWGDEIPHRIGQLRDAGRPISTRTAVTDAELVAAYQRARFTVFVSLHEGYGLPVAESLAVGTPVITTDFGSTAQIAADGGALLVDPTDDEALVEAMRRLLTDDTLLDSLREEARARPTRTWEQYASELWSALVRPELTAPGREEAA